MTKNDLLFFGCRKSPNDPRDYQYQKAVSPTDLPKIIDLRNLQSPVRNQSRLGSCTGQTLTSAIEYYRLKKKDKNAILSPLFSYYKAREIEGTTKYDNGAYLRDNCKSATKIGVSLESYWPYVLENFDDAPSWSAEFNARFYKIKKYERLTSINQVLVALADGDVVLAGWLVFSNIYSDITASKGWVVMPKDNEQPIGGHAMLIIGYDLQKKFLIIKNSWGTSFGIYGFLYMPFAYYDKYILDAWKITV